MKKKSVLWISMLLLMSGMLCACSGDDDAGSDSGNYPQTIVGEWNASHHNKNPQLFDTADMWHFTFNADGTGTGPLGTRTFRYEIKGDRITLFLTNIEAYYGQTVFEYKILNLSDNDMEWDEIPSTFMDNRGLYLKFHRSLNE